MKRAFSATAHFLLLIGSAAAGAWFYHYGDTSWAIYGGPVLFGLFGVYVCVAGPALVATGRQLVLSPARKPHTLVLKGLTWDRNEFCRGWLIRGKTGCGKTKSGILNIMFQVFTNEPGWGGVCIDEKGLFWETLCAMARHFEREGDLLLLQVRPEGAGGDWKPSACFNLLSDARIPYSTYAKAVVDTATSLGQKTSNSFFKEQAETHIGKAMELLEEAGFPVTMTNVLDVLMNNVDAQSGERCMDLCLEGLRERLDNPRRVEVYHHFQENYTNIAPEQRDGVKGTISNYLKNYVPPDIAQVFSPAQNTFEFANIDQGKIVCIAMPQKYQTERRYVSTFLKMLYYGHVLRRFDKPEAERRRDNLLILWADEAQNSVTAAEDGLSDYNCVDKIREAGGTVVAATQSTTSFIPPLGKDKAKVFTLNLSNQIIFLSADEEDAKDAADFIGQREIVKKSWGTSGGRTSYNYSKVDQHQVKPHRLRKLRNHQCYLVHCNGQFKKVYLEPIEPDGRISPWFPNSPAARFWRWLRAA